MNKNEKYFVSIMSAYLNGTTPARADDDIDWNEIYRLSTVHNVAAVAAVMIQKLTEGNIPNDKILSEFRQQTGYTVIDAAEKEQTVCFLKEVLNGNNIDFILIKGAVLRELYPIKELRTGSDTDVIIRNEDLKRCEQAFCEMGCSIKTESVNVFSVYYKNQHIEMHSVNDYDNPFFADIFDFCSKKGNEYLISEEYHLLYVLCHIIKHFNFCGAGIKMFMDIDVLIRSIKNFDYDKFMAICRKINIETFAKASFALCRNWFATPVRSEYNFESNKQLIELFETEIIRSGSFGFDSRDLGNHYINKGMGNNAKNGLVAKFRALIIMIFPPKQYLKSRYAYLSKRPYLLPFAWLSRLCAGIFKRSAHSKNTIRSIIHTNSESEQYKKLLDELGI